MLPVVISWSNLASSNEIQERVSRVFIFVKGWAILVYFKIHGDMLKVSISWQEVRNMFAPLRKYSNMGPVRLDSIEKVKQWFWVMKNVEQGLFKSVTQSA